MWKITIFILSLSFSCGYNNRITMDTYEQRCDACLNASKIDSFLLDDGTKGYAHNVKMECVIGSYLPDIKLIDITSEQLELKKINNDYLLINFWFTKCAPCIKEIPLLNKIKEEIGCFDVLSICNSPKNEIIEFLEKNKFLYTHVSRQENNIKSYFPILWGYPMTIIADKTGKIIKIFEILNDETFIEIKEFCN